MSSPANVYILAIDSGCEGHSPPVQAFTDYGEAKAALALLEAGVSSGWRLYRVPIWPEPATITHDIKPLEIDR